MYTLKCQIDRKLFCSTHDTRQFSHLISLKSFRTSRLTIKPQAVHQPTRLHVSDTKSAPKNTRRKPYRRNFLQNTNYINVQETIDRLKASPSLSKSLTSHDIRRLIAASFDAGNKPQALELVSTILPPSGKNFSILLKECIQRKDPKMLDETLSARSTAGLLTDSYSASAQLTGLSISNRHSEVLSLLQQLWTSNEECRTVAVANAAISVAADAADWATAQHAFKILKDSNLSADIVTYNALIKTAGSVGLMNVVVDLYNELLNHEGLEPTPVTYTSIFKAAARNSYPDADWLLNVYQSMKVAPNNFVLSSFFTAISYATCTREQLDAVFDAFALYRSTQQPNDVVYAALLTLVTRQGIPERAIDVWQAVQQDEVPLDAHLFSCLFTACTSGTSPALVDVALEAYSDLHAWWGAQDKDSVSWAAERDVRVAYNSLLNFIGETGVLDEAITVLMDMKHSGPLPDTVTYNTIIAAAAHLGEVDTAVQMFGEMVDSGLDPSEHTFGALINAFAKAGDAPTAQRIFETMPDLGVQANTVTFTTLIDALVKEGSEGSLDLAFALLDEMRVRGVKPSTVTYGCLLVACEQRNDVEKAFDLYSQLLSEGLPPSDECHDILINVCTAAGRLDDALELVKGMARRHAPLQQHTMNSLIRALCAPHPSRALRMLSLMKTMGMSPSRRTYLALITACAKTSDVEAAMTLYGAMRREGLEVDGETGSVLIQCLCQAQRLDEAAVVFDDMMATAWYRGGHSIPSPSPLSSSDDSDSSPYPNHHQHHHSSHSNITPTSSSGITPYNKFTAATKGSPPRKAALPKRAQVPNAAALASLAQAYAAIGQLRTAFKYYKQLKRQGHGGRDVVMSHRRMFELLIEGSCRQQQLGRALRVFDDWKAATGQWFVLYPNGIHGKHPKLSNVSLAFLEACCRSDSESKWRVYDVCSVMRLQKERSEQSKLARPQKASHHVLGSLDKE